MEESPTGNVQWLAKKGLILERVGLHMVLSMCYTSSRCRQDQVLRRDGQIYPAPGGDWRPSDSYLPRGTRPGVFCSYYHVEVLH